MIFVGQVVLASIEKKCDSNTRGEWPWAGGVWNDFWRNIVLPAQNLVTSWEANQFCGMVVLSVVSAIWGGD